MHIVKWSRLKELLKKPWKRKESENKETGCLASIFERGD